MRLCTTYTVLCIIEKNYFVSDLNMKFFCLRWKKENLSVIGFLLLLSLATIVYWKDNYSVKWNPSSLLYLKNERVTVEKIDNGKSTGKPKLVLYWNTFYGRPDMGFGIGQEPFLNAGCKINNCIATSNRSLFNDSAGIIIHSGNYVENDLPAHRFPHQRFIFLNYETLPEMSQLPCFSRRHFYNWTMTYRRDSDVYIADQYGGIRRKASSPLIEQLLPILPPGERPVAPANLMKYVENDPRLARKNKLIAWFCSNNKTHGRREDYFRELGKHVAIDIYGNCGNKSCMPKELNRDKCDLLLDEYKFYLSAENSLCPDYISEKFYRALRRDIIPVVYGGADYSAYAPPHSYIHISDFKSPKELAEYLLLLDKNDALYLKYFEWKKDYEVIRWPQDGWCDLCKKLNDPQEPNKSYESLAKWWYDDVPCYPGTSFLQKVLKGNG